MLKKITFMILAAAVCVSFGCHHNTAKQAGSKPHKKHWVLVNPASADGFDDFFKRFQADEAMQRSHIQFPLKVLYLYDEGEGNKIDSVRIMQKGDWHFSAKQVKGLITQKIYKSPNEMQVLFQVADTGINTVYVFKRLDNSWRLIQIEDSSD